MLYSENKLMGTECDICGKREYSFEHWTDLKRTAKEDGWEFIKGRLQCPDCNGYNAFAGDNIDKVLKIVKNQMEGYMKLITSPAKCNKCKDTGFAISPALMVDPKKVDTYYCDCVIGRVDLKKWKEIEQKKEYVEGLKNGK